MADACPMVRPPLVLNANDILSRNLDQFLGHKNGDNRTLVNWGKSFCTMLSDRSRFLAMSMRNLFFACEYTYTEVTII